MKIIYLDDRHHPLTITDEAYAQIVAIVEANRVCSTCRKPYTYDRPMVAENLCVLCLLKKEEHRHLRLIGVLSGDRYGTTYNFLDPKGYVHLSSTSSEIVVCSEYQTLKHWGFPVPTVSRQNGQENHLNTYSWSIYGQVQDSVIVLRYHEDYGGQLTCAFIAFKDGRLVEINKRKRDIQRVFKQARERIEATKDEKGSYHITSFFGEEDHTTYRIEESHLYVVIAEMLSAEYETNMASQSGKEDN